MSRPEDPKDNSTISKFNLSISGINFLDEEDLKSLVFVSRPTIESTFDVTFENGFELRMIPVKVYYSKFKTSIVIDFRKKKIIIDSLNGDKGNFQISFEFDKPYGNPKDELEAFKLLKYFIEGQSFTVFLNNGKRYPGGITTDEIMVEKTNRYIVYFEMLLAIEKHYGVRFNTIDEITDEKYNTLCLLYEAINGEEISYDFTTTLEATITEIGVIEKLIVMNEASPAAEDMSFVYNDFQVHIYGQTIRFKERIWRIYDPEIVNIDELKKGSNRIELRSKSMKASDKYILPTCE